MTAASLAIAPLANSTAGLRNTVVIASLLCGFSSILPQAESE